jgi:hypothetical protein
MKNMSCDNQLLMRIYIILFVYFAEIPRPRSDLINNEVNNSNHDDKISFRTLFLIACDSFAGFLLGV